MGKLKSNPTPEEMKKFGDILRAAQKKMAKAQKELESEVKDLDKTKKSTKELKTELDELDED